MFTLENKYRQPESFVGARRLFLDCIDSQNRKSPSQLFYRVYKAFKNSFLIGLFLDYFTPHSRRLLLSPISEGGGLRSLSDALGSFEYLILMHFCSFFFSFFK